MLFYLFAPSFFEESLLEELSSVSEYKIVRRGVGHMIIDAPDDFGARIKGKDPVFVYSVFRLDASTHIDEEAYVDSIYQAVIGLQPGKIPALRIECVDVDSKRGMSAKVLEVSLGQRLEKEGVSINIHKPSHLLYVILFGMECYVGIEEWGKLQKKFVDPLRWYGRYRLGIGRAELKLKEAFDEFGLGHGDFALDLGAAPGGWTLFLAQEGYKVLAVDNAALDYKRIRGYGVKVGVARGLVPDMEEEFSDNDILHMVHSYVDMPNIVPDDGFDLITNDMNMPAEQSAKAVAGLADRLKGGCAVVMTVKCMSKKVHRHIDSAMGVLSDKFDVISVKALPSNRQEVTLFARKRS